MSVANNSDYKKVRTRIDKLLPAPYQSETTEALMENTVNRFLTKKDTVYVDGYIGKKNTAAIQSRQVVEDTIIAQANQLQPIVTATLGTEKRYLAWTDIINELEEQGVDMEQFAEWGASDQYNWVPPIDIDKLLHFGDYFWVDENASSSSEYITIRSMLNEAKAKYSAQANRITRYGSTFPIVGLHKSAPDQVFIIKNIDATSNYISVEGDVTGIIAVGDYITIRNTQHNNAQVQVVAPAPSLISGGKTRINVASISQSEVLIGQAVYSQYDGVEIDDDYTLLFEPGFKTHVANSANAQLDGTSITVTSAAYDNDRTLVHVDTSFTNSSLSGDLSLDEQLAVLEATVTAESNISTATFVPTSERQWSDNNKWVHRADVENFASARQANYPIIEFARGLQLNEYIKITHIWNYRAGSTGTFATSSTAPSLIELIGLNAKSFANADTTIVFDAHYGDLTHIFTPGYIFKDSNNIQSTTVSAVFRIDNGEWNTVVDVAAPVITSSASQFFQPTTTSLGDVWRGYDKHWSYGGIADEAPAVTPMRNFIGDIPSSAPVTSTNANYNTRSSAYAQEFEIKAAGVSNTTLMLSDSALHDKVIYSAGDLRVYLNGERMYGGYSEIIDGVTSEFVAGIELDNVGIVAEGDKVLIEVSAPALQDQGFTNVRVRTEVDDVVFSQSATPHELMSIVTYRKSEQIKTEKSQYPQFSLFNIDGTGAPAAASIFEYKLDRTQPVSTELGMRVAYDSSTLSYTFTQSLIKDEYGLYAYATTPVNTYWVDKGARKVYKNIDRIWNERFQQGDYMLTAQFSTTQPSTITGSVWFDPITDTLYEYNGTANVEIDDVIIMDANPSLNSIWKKSTNQYVPQKRDWNARTLEEYNSEKETYITAQSTTIAFNNPTFTDAEVNDIATTQWFTKESNKLSPTGEWIGDWTIPDYMYYNPQNANKADVTTRELVGHLESIINAQPRIPGYTGDLRSQFHVFDQEDIDFGAGGKIRQYNNNFSTFVSSVLVDNIVIPDLFEFAQNQYQITIDNARDIARSLVASTLSAKPESPDIQSMLVSATVSKRSEDNNLEFIYGDTTSYDHTTGIGVRNWIATLPNFGIVAPVQPSVTIDKSLNLYELIHHDGHRANYAMSADDIESILDDVIEYYMASISYGVADTSPPPKSYNDLYIAAAGNIAGMTQGFYWIDTSNRKLYISYIDFIQGSDVAVPDTIAESYWMNTTSTTPYPEGLYYSDGNTWTKIPLSANYANFDMFDGVTIETSNMSLWKEIDINEMVLRTLLDIEQRLYDVSANTKKNEFSISSNLEQYFLAYTKASDEPLPFINTEFSPLDPFSWNYRNTVFGNNFNIEVVDIQNNAFVITGNYAAVFPIGNTFRIKNSNGNDGTWTVASTPVEDTQSLTTTITVAETITSIGTGLMYDGTPPSVASNTGAESASYWKALYAQLYGTPYPNIEPWKLQGYTGKPTWWDSEYKNDDPATYGSRRWKQVAGVGMWTQILAGKVPVGKILPNGAVSSGVAAEATQYDYVSVNIGDVPVSADLVTYYQPDDVYPPYFNHVDAGLALPNRSLFSNFSSEILGATDNYVFGENFQLEYEWRESSQFLYDYAVQSYIESPILFVSKTFGHDTTTIDDLIVDRRTETVPSYKRTIFHGELNGADIEKFNGINQWYINYNRYTNVDTNLSNFVQLWTTWTAPLSYRFNSFIDVRTLDIDNSQVAIAPNIDYSVYVKKTNGVQSFSITGLSTTLLEIPPKVINYDNSHLWKIQVSNNSVRTNDIEYYGVRNYPFYADYTTNTMTIYTYKIISTNEIRKTVELDGDMTDVFTTATVAKFSTTDEFSVVASIYSDTTNTTTLYFNDSVATISSGDVVSVDVTTLPWETGDSVWFTTERKLPAPLYGDTAPIGPIQYFIIKLSDTEFRVAETQRNALAGLPVVLANSGASIHYVGQIQNSFVVGNGVNTTTYWRHYALDTRITKTMNLPGIINGVQQYIDVIDGYVEKMTELGFTFADNSHGWQSQIEHFIDYSFSVRQRIRNRTVGNRFDVKPSKNSGSWSWTEGFTQSPIPTGHPVNVAATTGGLPAPFLTNMPYYIITNSDGTFNLASSANKASAGIHINLLDNGSANDIQLFPAVDNVTRYPKIEVNMFKDRISFRPPYGVVSDVITGPFSDINVANAVRDQYGDPMLLSDFVVNRQDAQTDIFLTSIKRIDDTTVPDSINDLGSEGYHYISAATFYIDTYEHIVEFTDYTSDGNLIYDGFVGLNLNRFNINYNRPAETSLRPNIGGSTVISDGKNLSTIDNIERMTDDLRTAYGAVANNESNRYSPYARKTLGYDDNSTEDYLTSLNINENSQFLFWQGLIQVKGSTRSIDSFINSKKFIDAQIDEFWAYQVADFGSVEDKEYPQMYINSTDIVNNTAKFEFIEAQETAKPGFDVSGYGAGGYDILTGALQTTIGSFNAIAINDSTRWYRQPDQSETLNNNGLVMHFESRASNMLELNLADYVSDQTPTIVHNFKSDSIEVVVEFPEHGVDAYTARTNANDVFGFDAGGIEVVLHHNFVPFVNQISVFKNGVAMESPTDYVPANQSNVSTTTSNKIRFTAPLAATDVVEVSYGAATLAPDIHFTTINSNIIRFENNQLFQLADRITIWGLYSNFEAHNATKLIDVVDDSVVSTINLFDPARGMYNQLVYNDVDIISDIPPAQFNQTEKLKVEPIRPDGYVAKHEWSEAEVGTIWVDTSRLAYVPYYDEHIFADVDERLDHWGKQTDYSKLRVYEWVSSTVHPSEYADLVEDEQGNTSIPEFLQKSGKPKQTVFLIEYGPAPDYTLGYRELQDYVHEYSVLFDGTSTTTIGEYTFNLPADFAANNHFNVTAFEVYVNGIYKSSEVFDDLATTITVSGLTEADYVQIVIDYDVDDDILAQAVEDLVIRISYEYTEVVSYTDIGEEITTYYFWVEDKLTRALNNSVSAKEIENKWTNVTYPYLVLQQPEPAERVESSTRENFDVDYSFTIGDEHLVDGIEYLQMGQTQADYSSGVYTGAGAFTPGEGYQPGDIITLSNGAVVEVISSDGTSAGEVTDFVVLYSGTTQPAIGDILGQQSVVSGSVSATGFELQPSTHNFGGFMLRLTSAIESYEEGATTAISSLDTMVITINDDIVYQKNDTTKSGEFVYINNKQLIVGRSVELNDTVRVQYESNRAVRSDELPHRYTQAIIRNIRSYINEDNRYTIRFRKDFTQDSDSELDNKTLHQEWKLFRQHQQSKIDRYLWDKVTESMIGHKLDDDTSIVPTVARQLYDAQYSDDTRFGLGNGQAFVSGSQALTTIISDLNDVDNEFRGIDVASFLSVNSFDSTQAITTSMEIIYTTFPTADVNRMFFLFLNDALAGKKKYAKLLKTSMISVYGVKVLDTQEFFDE